MNRYDVLIVGMGPTGITLAALLAQRGIKVAAFDKLPDLYPLPRAVGLDHEAMRLLQQLGLAEKIAPHVAPYRPSEYRGVDGKPILRVDAVSAPYPLGWAPNYVFNQPALENLLRDHVAHETGVLLHVNTEVTDSGQDENGVWIETRSTDNATPQRFEASYLVACDGGSSPIRKRLSIPFEDLGFDEAWLVIDSIVPPEKLAELPQTQVQYCEPARPATFVVGPGNHRRWEIMLQPGDSTATPFPEAEIWKLLQRWVKPGEIKLWRSAAYRFHGLVAKQWHQQRVFLAGDAAHMTPPFMAQGMMQGLRDAQNLSWKLATVIKGDAAPALLNSYAQERRPHTIATTRAAIELGRIICERDPAKAIERDAALRTKHLDSNGEIKTTVRQNLIPSLSDGLIDTGTPGHGQLFPQPRVNGVAPDALLDDLTGPVFRLVALELQSPDAQASLLAALQRLHGKLICLSLGNAPKGGTHEDPAIENLLLIEEAGAVIEPWMRTLGVRYAVVRPDHYVYGTADNVDEAVQLLATLHERLLQFKPESQHA